jgi:hypothetical protein
LTLDGRYFIGEIINNSLVLRENLFELPEIKLVSSNNRENNYQVKEENYYASSIVTDGKFTGKIKLESIYLTRFLGQIGLVYEYNSKKYIISTDKKVFIGEVVNEKLVPEKGLYI